jgi:hypothetical protein
MPHRELLTESQRLSLHAPASDERGMVRHYMLSSEDLVLINRRRGDPNRLGFALMLCYLRFPERILLQGERPPLRYAPLLPRNEGSMRHTSAITPNEIKLAGSTSLKLEMPWGFAH